ncbi:MAG: tryptophan synthase subunit alpha [Deinococcus sp.]|nr:tryptophan synthase subunit alpha [Deinococcus sp.]
MSRLKSIFERAKAQGRAVFMPYFTAGYPDLPRSPQYLEAVARHADIVELGLPFSDPIADGPTIQKSSEQALRSGITPRITLQLAAQMRQRYAGGLVIMSYMNPILTYGPQAFARDAAQAGVDGLIVPDLPPEEADEVLSAAQASGLDLSFLVAPTSTPPRIRAAARGSGFLYAVSVTGVTGMRDSLPPELAAMIQLIRQHCSLPVAVGFGVATSAQARQIAQLADGVIVGSALIERAKQGPVALAELCAELARALTPG